MLRFFISQNAINHVKGSHNRVLLNTFSFSPPFSIVGAESFVDIVSWSVIEAIVSNVQILSLFSLFRTWEDFLPLLNLIIVQCPLIQWQSSIPFESQTKLISPKMLKTVICRFLPSTDGVILRSSKHSILLYFEVIGYEDFSQVKLSVF